MIGADAAGREFERIAQLGVERVIGGVAIGSVDPPVGVFTQPVMVEARGVIDQRIIAALAHFIDHVRDIAPDLRIAFAPVAHDARKGALKTFSRSS